jgi:ribosomal 50S subunit-recycling heat shock protein
MLYFKTRALARNFAKGRKIVDNGAGSAKRRAVKVL